jgi:hypothetical protein
VYGPGGGATAGTGVAVRRGGRGVTVRSMDLAQVHSLQWHLDRASEMDSERVEEIRTLAAQLRGKPVLPILGAGASYDCGMRLASDIGEDLYNDYMSDPAYEPRQVAAADLADVAQAIHNHAGQVAVVRALGLPDPALWPNASDIDEHFCAYRVLARLAHEPTFQFDEAIGFNYDCGKEAALVKEGFLLSARTSGGAQWPDHARVIADRETFYELVPSGALTYLKAHGCAARFREMALTDEATAAETIVVCKGQLTHWRQDGWVQDRLRDHVRTRVVLLIGFAGQDPAIHGELVTILQEVYQQVPPQQTPRVVVIDWQPNTPTLQGLVKDGLGDAEPAVGMVTAVKVAGASTTAALLILLGEFLRLGLEPSLEAQGYELPEEVDPQLAGLAIAAPVMLRWTYMLHQPAENQFVQKINLEQAAENGYVPLLLDPEGTVRVLHTRSELRQRLRIAGEEGTKEALAEHSFVVSGGFAYLPTALKLSELRAACRAGGPIERARTVLGHPTGLECVLVSEDSGALRGVHIETGEEIDVPA